MSSSRGRVIIPRRLTHLFTPQTNTSDSFEGSGGLNASVYGLSLAARTQGTGSSTPKSAQEAGSSTPAAAQAALRQHVTLAPDGSLMPAHKMTTAITNIFKMYIDAGGYAWRFVSQDTKRIYFDKFKLFYWNDAIDDVVARKWASKAGERYKDFVSKAKNRRLTNRKPEFIPDGAWDTWCTYWDTEAAQEVSRKTKKNRLAEPDGPGTGQIKHRGGSRSTASYATAFAQERGVPIRETLLDTFYKMHCIDEIYTYPKSVHIAEEVEEQIVAELSQPLPDDTEPPPVDRNEI